MLGAGYSVQGTIKTSVTQVATTEAAHGTLLLLVSAQGTWNGRMSRQSPGSRPISWKHASQEKDEIGEDARMLLSKKIRLEVSAHDVQTLEFMQGKCRGLYNWWVMRLRNGEKWPGWEEAKKTLQESKQYDPELCFVYGKCLAEVYFRLHGAMQAFFRRVKNGEKPGFDLNPV